MTLMALPKKFDKTLARRLLKELDGDQFVRMLMNRTLFRGLSPAQMPLATLVELSASTEVISLKKKKALDLKQSDALYEIISGYVKIYDRGVKPWEQRLSIKSPPAMLAWRIPGELLGDFRFMVPDATLDRIEATDECRLLKLPAALLHRLAQTYPQIYINIAHNLAAKAIKTRVRAQILREPNVNCMIAKMFLELLAERGHEEVVRDGKRWQLVLGSFHVRDIAAFLGYKYHGAQLGVRALIEKELMDHHQSPKSGRYVCDAAGLHSYLENESLK